MTTDMVGHRVPAYAPSDKDSYYIDGSDDKYLQSHNDIGRQIKKAFIVLYQCQ